MDSQYIRLKICDGFVGQGMRPIHVQVARQGDAYVVNAIVLNIKSVDIEDAQIVQPDYRVEAVSRWEE